jgi:hypothetical protein
MPRLGLACAGLALSLLGCFGYSRVERDSEQRPEIHTGVRATILYPGQQPPPLPPPSSAPRGGAASTGAAPPGGAPGTSSTQGAAAGTGGGESLLGGSTMESVQHDDTEGEIELVKPLTLPFAILAWPVKKVVDAVRSEPEPTPPAPLPSAEPPKQVATRDELQRAWDAAEVDRMRAEIAQRGAAPPAPPVPAPQPGAGGRSIAEELAALRSARSLPPAGTRPAAAAGSPTLPDAPPSRVLDRDRDGRPDQWVYLEGGQPRREVFDDAGDGSPNRWVLYEPQTGSVLRMEEDLDGDGDADAWEEYRDAKPVRRRADTDGSGLVDSWTFYRDGIPLRHEQDTNGDGFRDRLGYYEAGRLVREEEDRDGDGAPDRITHYDESGRPERIEEDSDGDGGIDQRSFYEAGKLVRRELVEGAARQALGEGAEAAEPPPDAARDPG